MPLYRCWSGGSSTSNNEKLKTVEITPSKNQETNSDGYTEYTSITPDSGYDGMEEVRVKVPQVEKYDEDLGIEGDAFSTYGWLYGEDPMFNPDAEPYGISIRPSKTGMVYEDCSYALYDIIDNSVVSVTAPATGYEEVASAYGKLFNILKVYPTPSEEKTISPSSSSQIVTPSTGKLLSQVTVNAINNSSGQIYQITPTYNSLSPGYSGEGYTNEYTITKPSGYDGIDSLKIKVPQLDQLPDNDYILPNQDNGDGFELYKWVYDSDPFFNEDAMPTAISIKPTKTGMVYIDKSYILDDIVALGNDVHYTITTDEGRNADQGHIDVTPSQGKVLLDAVVSTEAKTVTPTASQQVVVPTDAQALYKVTVNAVQTESKTVTATTEQQTVTPASGKFLSSVTVKPQQHTGSKNGGTVNPGETKIIDLTATHNIRNVEVRGKDIQLQNKSVTVDYIPYGDEYYTDYIEVTQDTGYDALSKARIRLPMLKSTEAIRFVGWHNKYEDPNDGELGEPVEDDDESRFIEAGNESVLFITNGGVLASSQWLTVDMLQTKAVTISSNGTSYVFPDAFKAMRAVKIITNVGGSSSGGSFEEVALYTNSSPSSSQGDVTFNLSQSINNFKYLKFVYRKSTSNSETASVIVPVSEFKQTAYSNGYAFVSLSAYMASSTAWCRPVYYKSATSIECKTPRRLARTETSGNSGYCIVTNIYGLN